MTMALNTVCLHREQRSNRIIGNMSQTATCRLTVCFHPFCARTRFLELSFADLVHVFNVYDVLFSLWTALCILGCIQLTISRFVCDGQWTMKRSWRQRPWRRMRSMWSTLRRLMIRWAQIPYPRSMTLRSIPMVFNVLNLRDTNCLFSGCLGSGFMIIWSPCFFP